MILTLKHTIGHATETHVDYNRDMARDFKY
jgi:hypothetical protein